MLATRTSVAASGGIKCSAPRRAAAILGRQSGGSGTAASDAAGTQQQQQCCSSQSRRALLLALVGAAAACSKACAARPGDPPPLPEPTLSYWRDCLALAQKQLGADFQARLTLFSPKGELPSGSPGDPAKDYGSSGRRGDGRCGPYLGGGGGSSSGAPYAFCPAPGVAGDDANVNTCCRHFAYCIPASRFGLAAIDRVATVVASPRLLALPEGRQRAILAHEMGHVVDFFLFGARYSLPSRPASLRALAPELRAALQEIDAEPDPELRADLLGELLVLRQQGKQLCYDPVLLLQLAVDPAQPCSGDGSDPTQLMRHYRHAPLVQGLWLGGIACLSAIESLAITHVVSVLTRPDAVQHRQLGGCSRLGLNLNDSEDANLLQQLPPAMSFMDGALQSGGRVLVHCAQGVSRSASLTAAYLMHSRRQQQGQQQGQLLSAAAAVAAVRERRPMVAPNPGFMRQLELWGAMGCRLEGSHLPYKRFLLEQAGLQYEKTGSVDAATLTVPSDAGGGAGGAPAPTLYRCRKCRGLVATAHNVVDVEEGPGAVGFSWHKRYKQQRQLTTSSGEGEDTPVPEQEAPLPWARGGSGSSSSRGGGGTSSGVTSNGASTEEGSLFVEPLRWMCGSAEAAATDQGSGIMEGTVQGKLYCPKCRSRLGSFNWAGTQSSSGAWVTPAFQLHLNKLDAVDPQPPSALSALRQPRLLAGTSASPVSNAALTAPAQGTPAPAAAPVDALTGQLTGASLIASAAAGASSAAASQQQQAAATSDGTPQPQQQGEQGEQQQPWLTHLILDCDGVMVDSERASCEVLRQAVLQVTGFDIPHAFPRDFQPVFGMDVRHCVEYYAARFPSHEWGEAALVAEQVSAVKEGIYQRLTQGGVAAFDGVRELIAQARLLGLGVAVASSGSPQKIAHNLDSSGLAGLVEPHLVVSAKHVARGKPAPDVYLEALARLGCADPGRALVVEDAVNGLKAANAAGCYAVAITNSLPTEALAPHAQLVVQNLREVDLAAVRPSHQPAAAAGRK